MNDQLILAVPSKGRLEEATAEFFAKAGLPLKRDSARGYRGTLSGFEGVRVEYVSAAEIAVRLADGSAHIGITGEDLLRETIADMDSAVQLVMGLGFGQADVVVAVPDGWVDVSSMFDLADVAADFRARHGRRLRVATKYTHLAADFFARHHVSDIELVQSFGATEAAPHSGAAEVIVDITSSGATLAANDLRVPQDGLILQSVANLAASLKADWNQAARSVAKRILRRLSGHLKAAALLEIKFSAPHDSASLFDDFALEGSTKFANAESVSYALIVQADQLDDLTERLAQKEIAATVSRPDFIFSKRNAAYERLMGAL